MICPRCGEDLPNENLRFCDQCGTPLPAHDAVISPAAPPIPGPLILSASLASQQVEAPVKRQHAQPVRVTRTAAATTRPGEHAVVPERFVPFASRRALRKR